MSKTNRFVIKNAALFKQRADTVGKEFAASPEKFKSEPTTAAADVSSKFTMGIQQELEQLREKLADAQRSQGAQIIDPDKVLVPGFNRLPDSFDPNKDKEFALLCENIRTFGGNKQPALVRPSGSQSGYYDLVFGERRMRACQLTHSPFSAIVTEINDEELALLRELENVGRKDKSLIERALSLFNISDSLPDRLARGERAVLLKSLKISNTHYTRFKQIAQVPFQDIWAKIPNLNSLSFRSADRVISAYNASKERTLEIAKSLPPDVSHKEAIDLLTEGVDVSNEKKGATKTLVRKGGKFSLSFEVGEKFNSEEVEASFINWLKPWFEEQGIPFNEE